MRRWPSFKTIQNYVRWSKCLNELVARCETLCLTMANRQLADTVRDKSHPFMFQYIIIQRMIYNKKMLYDARAHGQIRDSILYILVIFVSFRDIIVKKLMQVKSKL